MVELIVNDTKIELSKDTSIKYTKQISDIFDIANVACSFTNSFAFEKSPKNTQAMQQLGIVSDQSQIPYQKNNAILKVDGFDLISQGWNILQNEKYAGRIFMYDSERDSFMVALKALGYSTNTANEAELQAAYDWLVEVNNTMNPVYVTDEVIDQMINGTKDIAVMYSGDAVYVEMENEDMAFYVPNQGTNIWVDAMVIPANARNSKLAHQWIDFMLEYDVALANTYEVAYTTPIQAVFDDVTAEGEEFEDYLGSYVPRLNYELDETFRHNADTKRIMSDLWIRVKAQ